VDRDLPDVDGMWQLKTIESSTGQIRTVDTMYYSFQAQKLFSFTELTADPSKNQLISILYGYVDFPSKDRMVIRLDPAYKELSHLLPSGSESTSYFIQKLTSKEMILESEKERDIYRFIKF
jgi:hypothetical protein